MPDPDSSPLPKQNAATEQKKELPKALWVSRGVLVANIIALARLMQTVSFGWFVTLAYALFLIIGIEVLFEPTLKRIRWFLLFLVLAVMVWFGNSVHFAKAPVNLNAYVRPGNYPANTTIGGVSWDPHFTDLRVAVINPTNDDYKDLDVAIVPDTWIYEASLLSTGADCQLSRLEGNVISVATAATGGDLTVTARRVGNGLETYDNLGNIYKPLASENGYRLSCTKVPKHYTVQIVFASVRIRPDLLKRPALSPGATGLIVEEVNTKNIFDLLGPKPTVNEVFFNGAYTRSLKPYVLQQSIRLSN
jgi:hypothetical protein